MRHLRVAVLAAAALTFATTVAVDAAPEKKFSVAMAPAVVAASSTATLTATIKNETPNGNSSINSLVLTLPAGLTVANTTSDPPVKNWSGDLTYTTGGGSVSLSNMSPLKPLQSFTLTLKVSVGSTAATCSGLQWNAAAWTGSSFSGDTFRQLFPPELAVSSTTTIASGLALQFLPLADPVVQDEPFGVTVRQTSACGPSTTLPPAAITLAGTPNFTGGGTRTSSGGQASFTGAFGSLGPASLTATSPGYAPASMSLVVYDGELECEPGDPYLFSAPPVDGVVVQPVVTDDRKTGFARGRRGPSNKDGSACIAVGYTFVNDILNNNTVSLTWDTSGTQKGAAFEYTVTWKPEYVDATSGLPSRVTKVQWQGLVTPVNARACIGPELPASYGALAGAIPDNVATTFTITASSLAAPVLPFPVNVGSERMTVVAISGGTWTVQRGAGGTIAPLAGHAAGAQVMSTPLPLDGSGNQMQMCVVEERWFSTLAGEADCPAPADPVTTPPRSCVRVTTTVFDIGDGVMIRGGN